jgi:hypothetical protein
MALTEDVERFIARRFAPADREAARSLCASATIHDGTPAGPRLIRCALFASVGSLEKLRGEIEHLAIDYRDVIMAGEYVFEHGDPVRARDLNQPLDDEA